MGTARSNLFTLSSVLMILSGTGGITCAVLLTADRLKAADASLPITFITAAFMLIFSVIDLITGIHGVRSHNKRINSAVVIRLPEISIALCILCLILTLFNGILLSYMVIMLVCGILIPILFIYSAGRKSYL